MKKLAFFSGNPFGALGTAGTYNFVKYLAAYYQVRIFTLPPKDGWTVFSSDSLPVINMDIHKYLKGEISVYDNIISAFNPDIVYIFNMREWSKLLEKLKILLPDAKFVLDVKTPFLLEGDDRLAIQEKGVESQHLLDKIVTLSRDSVNTWIPNCTADVSVYPLAIDTSLFPEPNHPERQEINRFVIATTVHPYRQLDELIAGFAQYVQQFNPHATLDIFGTGKDLERLQHFIEENNYTNIITLKGGVEQNVLFSCLGEYDAAIAWVPLSRYSTSPSLKILEYMAASLPVLATSTEAHLQLLEEGFQFAVCADKPEELCRALSQVKSKRDSQQELARNRKLVSRYDYGRVIEEYIYPFLEGLFPHEQEAGERAAPRPALPQSKTLRMVFFMETLAGGRGGAEKIALETAKEMYRRGHTVYMMYKIHKDNILPVYSVNEDLIFIPFESWKDVCPFIAYMNPSLVMIFSFNRMTLVQLCTLLNSSIPVCLQECTNPERLITNTWKVRKEVLPLHIAAWERDILAAHMTRIRLVMPSYKTSFRAYIQPQVRAFPNPCPVHGYKADAGSNVGRKQIIFLNGIKQNKSFMFLLMAFHLLADKFPDWDIIMVGKNPPRGEHPYADKLYAWIEEHHLEERVIFTGSTDDVLSFYAQAHIHVIASLSEGCPTVVLEAMSVGLPSIGFADCAGTNELIRHEKNGLLVEAEERVEGLAHALERLMSDAGLRQRLGEQAFEDAKAFTPETIYNQWEQMFHEAAEYKHAPDRLLQEQMSVAPEAALHARRVLSSLPERQ